MTFRQPWAFLVATGQITLLVKERATYDQEVFLIHAGKLVDANAVPILRKHGADIPERLATRAFVGFADLLGVRRLWDTREELCKATGTKTFPVGLSQAKWGLMGTTQREVSRYAWILGYAQELPEPHPARGNLGFWPTKWEDSKLFREYISHKLEVIK